MSLKPIIYRPAALELTNTELYRLAEIRSKLIQLEVEGYDTASWEATFFLRLIEKLRAAR